MKNGNNDIFCYDHNCQPLPLSDTMPYTGIQSWIENNNKMIYKYLPVYMQLLTSIQEATEKIETPNTEQSTLLFDTVKDEAETDLPEESREKIRNTAQELLKLCTARGALPKAETVSEGDE